LIDDGRWNREQFAEGDDWCENSNEKFNSNGSNSFFDDCFDDSWCLFKKKSLPSSLYAGNFSGITAATTQIWNRGERESILIVGFGVKFLGLFMYESVSDLRHPFFLHVWICVDGFGYKFGILFVEKEEIWGWKVFCVVLWMKMKHKWMNSWKKKKEEERNSWKKIGKKEDGGKGKMVIRTRPGSLRAKMSLPQPSDDVSWQKTIKQMPRH
jgi:hypothetical protein